MSGDSPPAVGAKSTERERQVANSAIYLIPVLVGSVVPMMTLPIIARILTPTQYGAWALAGVYASFATGLANFGLVIGYERNFFQCCGPRERAALLYSVLSFVGVACAVGGAVTWVFRHEFARWIVGSEDAGTLLFFAYCASVVTSVKAYYMLYLRNTEDARAYAWFMIDETVLVALFSVGFVAWFRLGPLGLALGQLVAGGLILALLVRKVSATLRPAFDPALLMDSLLVSLPLMPQIFLKVFSTNAVKYLIGLLVSTGGVGIYSIGQRVGAFAFQYMTAIENVYTPQVYIRMFKLREGRGEAIGRYLTPFAYASAGVALLIALFAEELVTLLAPAAYRGAIPVAVLLTVGYGLMFFGKIPQLIYARKASVISVLAVVTLALNILFSLLLIPRFGIVGAAAGTLIAGVLSGSLAFAVNQHYLHIDWEYRKLGAIFGIFVAGALVTLALRQAEVAYGLRLLVKLLFVSGFAGLGLRLQYLSRDNYRMVRGLIVNRLRVKPTNMET